MTKSLHSQVNFNSGEWTPKLDARVDIGKYTTAARTELNMISYKQGPITRRPGTQFVANAKFQNFGQFNNAVNLQSFVFSPDVTFMLEFGSYYVRIYSGGTTPQPVVVSSAPAWVSGQTYIPGSYVTDLSGVAPYIYYTASGVTGTTAPHSDTTHWVAQTILEQPTPYNGSVVYPNTSIYETDVYTLSFCQINDVIYITHPDYPPYKLTRYTNTDWQIQQVNFLTPPFLDQNATDTTIAASAIQGNGITLTASAPAWATSTYYTIGNSVLQGGVIYNCLSPHVSGTFATNLAAGLWSVVTMFNSEHVGSTWQLAKLNEANYLEVDGTIAAGFNPTSGSPGTVVVGGISSSWHGLPYASPSIACLGGWELYSEGTWAVDLALQQSFDNGSTWNTVRTESGRSDRNFDISGTAQELSLYRFVLSIPSGISTTPAGTPATNPRIVFNITSGFIYGLVQITAITNAYTATANVIQQLGGTAATIYWSEGAWSNYRGFPQGITSYQQRLVYAGSGYEPQRIWMTVTNDIENFNLGDQTEATDAVVIDINAPFRGPIQWLIASTDLFVGLSGAEWIVNSGSTFNNGVSSGAAVTPTNINAVEHSSWGSADNVDPIIIADSVLFTQRTATTVRQMQYVLNQQRYISEDITTLSEHMFSAGIVSLGYATRWRRQPLVIAITQAGQLCTMTYEQDQEVYSWSQNRTGYNITNPNTGQLLTNDNGFETVSVIPGQGRNDDEIWVVVNRNIGNVQTRVIERINPFNWEENFTYYPNQPAPYLPYAYYVDCGTTIQNPGTLTLTGPYFNAVQGRWLSGLADGNAFGPIQCVQTAGVWGVTLPSSIPTSVGVVQIGIPIYYECQPMRFDSDSRAGVTMGLNKQISSVYLRVWNSMGGNVWNGTSPYTLWYGGTLYSPGAYVTSPASGLSYQCCAATNTSVDPALGPQTWNAGTSYGLGAIVVYNQQVYTCIIAPGSSQAPPAADTTHWVFNYTYPWVLVPSPVYSLPKPLQYTNNPSNPFAVPSLVTVPTDLNITPALNITPGQDPTIIITGQDALPLTVLGLTIKYEIMNDRA